MKRANLLKRSQREGRNSGGAMVAKDELKNRLDKYKPCNNTPTMSLLGGKSNKIEKGGLFSFLNRRKKVPMIEHQEQRRKQPQLTQQKKTQQKIQQQQEQQQKLPCTPPKTERRLESATPVTLDTETGTEVPLSIPCERVPSYAETAQTLEISDFSGLAEEELLEQRARSFKRTSSCGKTSSARMILDTSAVPMGKFRSLKLNRRTGNESLGDVKPDQPQRGVLPPILGDGEESVGESSCSGITMDFTYGEEMKTPMLQPVGRLGEGVPQTRHNYFVPPSYITTMDDDDDQEDELDLPIYGDM